MIEKLSADTFWDTVWDEYNAWYYEGLHRTTCSQCGAVRNHKPEDMECRGKFEELVKKHAGIEREGE
jgi:hypothetical protein